MRKAVLGFILAIALAGAARADVVDDVQTALDAHQFDKAITLSTKALGDSATTDQQKMSLHLARGVAYLLTDRAQEAGDDFTVVITRVKPDSDEARQVMAGAYGFRGQAGMNLHRLDDAVADFKQAMVLDPANADYPFELGGALNEQGKYDDAIAAYTESLKLRPDNPEAVAYRGESYENKKDFDKALADYNEALRLAPDYAMAYNDRGVLYQEQGKTDEALADLDKAATLEPDMPIIFLNRAGLHRQLHHWKEAIDDLNAALKLVGDPQGQAEIKKEIDDAKAESAKAPK